MKKCIAMLLCCVMLFGTAAVPTAASGGNQASVRDVTAMEEYAAVLKQLGLFKGVSETDFDLDRAPTRVEALVMLIRVLGVEREALEGTWKHPFGDVPSWADAYVGYAYENGLTNGISATEFGSGDATAAMYLTFVLRALGYSDADGKDFTWSDPFTLAKKVGILNDGIDTADFLRADVAAVSYLALSAKVKDSADTLADKLIFAGMFTIEQYGAAMQSKPSEQNKPSDSDSPAADSGKLTAVEISEKCADAVFYIEVYSYSGAPMGTGSGFFISSDGYAITNFHVAANSNYMIITAADGKKYDNIRLVDASKENDLALLKVKSDDTFKYLEAGDSDAIKQGQTVYAIGSPRGLDNTLSQGIISNVNRVIGDTAYIQISVPIESGSSGGALIDEYGKVIAVTSAGIKNNTADLNLAVPIKLADGLDKSNLNVVRAWNDAYYLGYDGVYDFGAFTGMQASESDWGPLRMTATYDASGITPVNPIDPSLPNLGVDAVFNECVAQYKKALSVTGFKYTTTADGWQVYKKGDTTVELYVVSSGKKSVTVYACRDAEYYKEAPTVPDAAWYLELEPVTAVKDGESLVYTYDITEKYDSIAYFAVDFAMYLYLLVYEDFEADTKPTAKSEDSISYIAVGGGYKVEMVITEKDITLKLTPLTSLSVSEPFARLRDYLIENGVHSEEYSRYRLEAYDGDDRYDVTYYTDTGRLCFGLYTESGTESRDGFIFIYYDGRVSARYLYEVETDGETESTEFYADIVPESFSSESRLTPSYYTCPLTEIAEYRELTLERTLAAVRYCDEHILPETGVSAADLGFTSIYN